MHKLLASNISIIKKGSNPSFFLMTRLDKPARLIIRFVFGFCIWLWDECGDPLRAGAKKVLASKMIFWVTWCSENDCQPSCTLQLHTDVLLFTSSSLKPLQNCHLDQSVPSAYRFWSSICLSFREQYLSHCLLSYFILIGRAGDQLQSCCHSTAALQLVPKHCFLPISRSPLLE